MGKGIVVLTLSVGCYYYIYTLRFSQDLQYKTWHCSSTLHFITKGRKEL